MSAKKKVLDFMMGIYTTLISHGLHRSYSVTDTWNKIILEVRKAQCDHATSFPNFKEN